VGSVCPAGHGNFPNTGETCCLPSEPCTPDASSIGVEWSGNVTAAGSTIGGPVWSRVAGRPSEFYTGI